MIQLMDGTYVSSCVYFCQMKTFRPDDAYVNFRLLILRTLNSVTGMDKYTSDRLYFARVL